jgi:thiol-disulfide isomerase/thioredoxin
MKQSTVAIGLAAVLFATAGAWYGNHRSMPAAAQSSPVTSLFAQTLPDLADKPQPLAQWRGKPLLVNFWATWCAPCVQEMPELSALQTEMGETSLRIVGIGIDSPANIREFAKKVPVTYPLYVGGMGGSELSRQMGNQAGGLPFSVLIGADGSIRKTYLGRLKMDEVRRNVRGM